MPEATEAVKCRGQRSAQTRSHPLHFPTMPNHNQMAEKWAQRLGLWEDGLLLPPPSPTVLDSGDWPAQGRPSSGLSSATRPAGGWALPGFPMLPRPGEDVHSTQLSARLLPLPW